MPRELAESAILGHKKGAFTGAQADRPGAFEEAHGGTLFLDEIGELPLELQPKLLRVLDRQELQRVGESRVRKVDVRVVAATHRDLRKMVGQGRFREDLYFRLSVMTVELPPLADRGRDIILLAERFLEDFRRNYGKNVALGKEVKKALMEETWPGNVRELKNTIERAAHFAKDGNIDPADLHLGKRPRQHVDPVGVSLHGNEVGDASEERFQQPFKLAKQGVIDEFERAYLSRLLEKNDHNLSRASAEAGLTRYYLRELLKRLGMHKRGDS